MISGSPFTSPELLNPAQAPAPIITPYANNKHLPSLPSSQPASVRQDLYLPSSKHYLGRTTATI